MRENGPMTLLTDEEIAVLIGEPKPAIGPADLLPRRLKRGHRELDRDFKGADGASFQLIVRQNVATPEDFSVILAYSMPKVHRRFRLRRHNGPSHRHPNKIEGNLVTGPHIHIATQRYQEAGFKEDAYAEATNRYSDLVGAIDHMLEVANFERPSQTTIFEND
jgi:hypothetical protein